MRREGAQLAARQRSLLMTSQRHPHQSSQVIGQLDRFLIAQQQQQEKHRLTQQGPTD